MFFSFTSSLSWILGPVSHFNWKESISDNCDQFIKKIKSSQKRQTSAKIFLNFLQILKFISSTKRISKLQQIVCQSIGFQSKPKCFTRSPSTLYSWGFFVISSRMRVSSSSERSLVTLFSMPTERSIWRALVRPIPWTYCREYSILLAFGISTPAIRAHRMVRCAGAWKKKDDDDEEEFLC